MLDDALRNHFMQSPGFVRSGCTQQPQTAGKKLVHTFSTVLDTVALQQMPLRRLAVRKSAPFALEGMRLKGFAKENNKIRVH